MQLRLLLVVVIISLVISSACASRAAEITRDDYGIPTITAATDKELFELWGYAVAEDRLWQLETNRRWARGMLAEILGAGLIPLDEHARLLGYTEEEYVSIFNTLSPDAQELVEAYVAGVNRRIEEVMADPDELLPVEFRIIGLTPVRWKVSDSLAMVTASVRQFGMIGGTELTNAEVLEDLMGRYDATTAQGMFNDLFWLNDPSAPAVTELAPSDAQPLARELSSATLAGIEAATGGYDQLVKEARELAEKMSVGTTLGSYGWVVSGDKTTTGYPILYGGPQFGSMTPSTIHVAHLKDDQGLNVVGISFPGFPGIIIGYNENVAWSQMVGMGDCVDTYVETLNPLNHKQYLHNGTYLDMDERVETVNVFQGEPINMTIYRTIHGPIVDPFPFDPSDSEVSQVYAQKSAHWMLEPKSIDGVWKMMQATNVSQFEEGIQEVYMPLHCIYADREGNIAYWHVGLLAERPGGFDPRLPLPGTGEAEWVGFRAQPKALNPEKGYLAAWNNKASPDLDNPDGPETWRFGKFHRVRWIYSFLEAKPTVTLEDIEEIALVIGSVGLTEPGLPSVHGFGYNIGELLSPLAQAVEEVPTTDPYHAQLNETLRILSAWDGRSVEDTVASANITVAQTIFDAWISFMIQNTFEDEFEGIYTFDTPDSANVNMLLHALDGPDSAVPPTRDYFDDVSTPDVVETVQTIMPKSMKQAIDMLSAQFETEDMTKWVAERPVITFSHSIFGTVSTIPGANRSTYSQVVELKPEGVEGSIHFALGNSGSIFPSGKAKPDFDTHFFDMQLLYIGYDYWPVPL